MNKKEILNEYKNKILAIESFGDNNKIYVDDFVNKEKLLNRLYQLDCQEISLTDDGLSFLKSYYGLAHVIDMLIVEIDKGVDFKYNDKGDLERWLEAKGELLS